MARVRDLQPEDSTKRAALRARYGEDIAEIVDAVPNDDWRDVQEFAKYVDDNSY